MNSKVGRKNISLEIELKKELTKQSIKEIEKIILKRVTPVDYHLKLGKRKFLDRRAIVVERARFIPVQPNHYSMILMKFKAPNISISIEKRKFRLNIQRIYSKRERLAALNDIYIEIGAYINTRQEVK